MALKWTPALEHSTVWPNPGEVARMADYAATRGVRLMLKKIDRRPVSAIVVDPRDPAPHAVTLLSCDCRMFATCGGCQHLALLQTTLNNIPEAIIVQREEIEVAA